MQPDAVEQPPPDLLLVGGGLANGLLAYRLSQIRPEIRVLLLESGQSLGAGHTWSFFDSDLTPAERDWTAPLVAYRWPGYQVRFPGHARRLSTPYFSVTSDRFDQVVRRALRSKVELGVAVTRLDETSVSLADGRTIRAKAVVDGRGPTPSPDLALGFQKFVGLELELESNHGLTEPIVMDATVDQLEGYRFLYVLPFGPDRLLVEDTRYTDDPTLDREALKRGALEYARAQGWSVKRVAREEDGVLPVALGGNLAAHQARFGPIAQVGVRSGLFHPTTGYSFPDAVRLAAEIADGEIDGPQALAARLRTRARQTWSERGFYRLLNRMLFRAAAPAQRYRILERFYRLPQPLVERFYAARSTLADKARILSGKPPVPLGAAIGCLLDHGSR